MIKNWLAQMLYQNDKPDERNDGGFKGKDCLDWDGFCL